MNLVKYYPEKLSVFDLDRFFDRFFYDIWLYINAFWVAHKFALILILIILILLIDLSIGRIKNS